LNRREQQSRGNTDLRRSHDPRSQGRDTKHSNSHDHWRPRRLGGAASLARPGANVTGVTLDAGIELHGKRLGLLREIRPDASRAAYLASSSAWDQPQAVMVREAAQGSRLSLTHVDLGTNLNDTIYKKAFESTDWTKIDVLLVSDEPEHLSNTRTLVDLVTSAGRQLVILFATSSRQAGFWHTIGICPAHFGS
jgi:hypothetical protein